MSAIPDIIGLSCFYAVLVPFVVFYCVKFAVHAYLKEVHRYPPPSGEARNGESREGKTEGTSQFR